MKVCNQYHCESKGKLLLLMEFPKNTETKDGRGNTCNKCIRNTYKRRKVSAGTLRERLESQGIKLVQL